MHSTVHSLHVSLAVDYPWMEPARPDRPEGRPDKIKNNGMEFTMHAKSGLVTKSSQRNKFSMDVVGKKDVPMRKAASSAASSGSRRGSISMLAQQLRMLEANKEGELRYLCGRVPVYRYSDITNFGLGDNVCKTLRTVVTLWNATAQQLMTVPSCRGSAYFREGG